MLSTASTARCAFIVIMPYQNFGFVQKNFTDTKRRVPLDMMLSTKKNDDLDSRQKNIIVELYRAALSNTNVQIQKRTSSIKAKKIKDMEYNLEPNYLA